MTVRGVPYRSDEKIIKRNIMKTAEKKRTRDTRVRDKTKRTVSHDVEADCDSRELEM